MSVSTDSWKLFSLTIKFQAANTLQTLLYQMCIIAAELKVLENISAAEFISVTTDMWTSDVNNNSFISLTAHWVTYNFELKHAVLNIKPFSGSHMGEKICNVLFEILNECNIGTEKLHLLLRDGGANIKKLQNT
ncbi:hypothetical protein NQ314_007068 [Rhamnusium bicolor]|uniref:Uncharacterized protein n=1 Tax=Rhamnusium bicolor TaxID=1586634 RepID=A0AAV8YST8_9CUCU|nr:hypothetical protein NQ314_007068 [Rhamnusium bicolor]